jgi:putative oxidoreductase
LQRLFTTFANGWPGRGLILLRLLTAFVLFYSAITHLDQVTPPTLIVLQMMGAAVGVLVLLGLWTPIAGILVTALELGIAFFFAGSPLISIVAATLGATLAMIGPGAWSIDAILFGRKRIATPKR